MAIDGSKLPAAKVIKCFEQDHKITVASLRRISCLLPMLIRRLFHSAHASVIPTAERLLLRDYIQQALYHPTLGYFSKPSSPILRRADPIHFPSVPDRQAYEASVATTYAKYTHGWMTPAELFSPHFSHAVANRIRAASPPHSQLHVIELGAGRGTLAGDILSFLETHDDALLSRLTYTLVDVSHTLSNLQRATLAPWIQAGVVNVVCADARQWFENFTLPDSAHHVHVLATELLDNLPHDLIAINSANQIQQAEVVGFSPLSVSNKQPCQLEWRDQIDSETAAAMCSFNLDTQTTAADRSESIMQIMLSAFHTAINSGTKEIWVPTASHSLLQAIVTAAPNASLTLADFTSFPGSLAGTLAPIIQRVSRGTAVVFDSVHGAPFGAVDIMFPTDFQRLCRAHAALRANVPRMAGRPFRYDVLSQGDFFKCYAPHDGVVNTTCADGYNPLLQDFENTALFVADCDADE